MEKPSVLIVTGLSGAGKSLAMNALEDIGYFCMDNIPASLLGKLVALAMSREGDLQRLAVVLDIRGGKSAREIMDALDELKRSEVPHQILFLDASDEVLQRRYKETRRRHPISLTSGVSVEQAVREEREILKPLYGSANYKIDTSLLSTAQLKDRVVSLFVDKNSDAMALNILSFGFKYGQPKEADIVFDVRCVPNPFYVPELKHKTGLDREVADYVMQFAESKELLRRLEDLLSFSLPLYVREGKSQLTIAVGCTGGMHRSVYIAKHIFDRLTAQGYSTRLEHRDLMKNDVREHVREEC